MKGVFGGWKVGGIEKKATGQQKELTDKNALNYLQAQGAGTSVSANTPVSVGTISKDVGAVQRVGNGVVYFAGLQQITDPSVANIDTLAIRAQSTMLAVAAASGKHMFSNPRPGPPRRCGRGLRRGPGRVPSR